MQPPLAASVEPDAVVTQDSPFAEHLGKVVVYLGFGALGLVGVIVSIVIGVPLAHLLTRLVLALWNLT